MNEKKDSEFEALIANACMKNILGSGAGMVVLFFLGLFLVYYGVKLPFIPLLILGLLPWGGIAFLIYRFRGDLKGEAYWIDLLRNQPEKIIWIKPIRVRHTAAYIITLYQEMHFQLLTADGLVLNLKCDSTADQQIFFRGLGTHTPHAHIGYSGRIDQLYSESRPQFIERLKKEQLYLPVAQFLSQPV